MDGHEAFLQAAGGQASRVVELLEGRAAQPTPFEHAIVELTRLATEAPARLTPSDVEPLRALKGEAATDYVLVLGAFHFINRIADLLEVPSEGLPAGLRRVEFVRRLFVRVAARLFGSMDLANRRFDSSYDTVRGDVDTLLDAADCRADRATLDVFARRPQGLEVLRHALEERQVRSGLSAQLLARVHAGVEAALPTAPDDAFGFHPRPSNPVDAFVFVGTRYAQRTTADMVNALRAESMSDLEIMDLAIAVADANQWARMYRLLGLDPALYYLPVDVHAGESGIDEAEAAGVATG